MSINSQKNIYLNNKRFIFYFFITAIIIFIYFPSINFPFFAEDYNYLYHVKNNFNLYDTFIAQFLGTKITGNFFYRPITRDGLFSITYNLFHLNPIGYRLVIFLLFILNNFFVYEITHSLTKRQDAAVFATLMYASRIAHFNSINWISAGFQAYGMVFFVLASILLYLLFIQFEKKLFYFGSLFLFFMALLSKETSFVLPLIIILIELTQGKNKLKQIAFRIIPFLIFDLFFIVRFLKLKHLQPSGVYENLLSAKLIFQNLISFVINSFNNSLEIATAGLLLLVITPLLFRLHNRLVLFAAGWLIIGLLPFLTLTSAALKNNEYYLDLSLVGFSMLFALCVCYYQDKFYFSRYIVTPLLCIIMFLSAFQFNRDKAHTRYVNQQPCINLLAYLKTNLPHVPNGSLLYFKGKDIERVYWLLGGGDAINLYYDNALVYFEGKDKTLPSNYAQIYFIELTGDVIKVSAPQQTTSPLAPP